MKTEELKTSSSVFGSLGLAIIGGTCCALPIIFVALGMGGAVASAVSALPWLARLSEYKLITFSLTGAVLAYSYWRIHRAELCNMESARTLLWQKRVLIVATVILMASMFAAFALLPVVLWLEGG